MFYWVTMRNKKYHTLQFIISQVNIQGKRWKYWQSKLKYTIHILLLSYTMKQVHLIPLKCCPDTAVEILFTTAKWAVMQMPFPTAWRWWCGDVSLCAMPSCFMKDITGRNMCVRASSQTQGKSPLFQIKVKFKLSRILS